MFFVPNHWLDYINVNVNWFEQFGHVCCNVNVLGLHLIVVTIDPSQTKISIIDDEQLDCQKLVGIEFGLVSTVHATCSLHARGIAKLQIVLTSVIVKIDDPQSVTNLNASFHDRTARSERRERSSIVANVLVVTSRVLGRGYPWFDVSFPVEFVMVEVMLRKADSDLIAVRINAFYGR